MITVCKTAFKEVSKLVPFLLGKDESTEKPNLKEGMYRKKDSK